MKTRQPKEKLADKCRGKGQVKLTDPTTDKKDRQCRRRICGNGTIRPSRSRDDGEILTSDPHLVQYN